MTPQYEIACRDVLGGVAEWRKWGRLGWQEIKRRYRRTTFGPFWTSMSLGLFIVTLGFVWANLWKQDPKQYLPFLTSGMLAWTLVSTLIIEGCSVFTAGESIVKSLRFNYTILTCAAIWRNLIVFCHHFAIFVLVALFTNVDVNLKSLLVIPGLALVAVNGVWFATLLGSVCARYRDIHQVVSSILQVAMFVTPVFWSPSQLDGRLQRFVDFNLLYHFVEVVREPMLGKAPSLWSYGMVVGSAVVGWTLMIYVFSRFRRRIPYWL
jgi:ABC-type polysaccharide/polyol phosphate export permease